MSDDRMTRAIDAVPEPMLLIGADGTIESANAAAESLLGAWIVGRSYATALRQPGLLGRIEAAQAGEAASEARFEMPDASGDTQFRVRITPYEDASAAITPGSRTPRRAILLHFTDITHLREAEEMRRDFVANVSHELRTPLTSVLGFIETLRGPARNDEAARERFLGIMEDEARRMNRLVSDLLSLSRVEAQERVRPNELVDLTQVLDSVLAGLRPGAAETGNEIEMRQIGEGPTLVRGDRDQLMQVVLNLTENALKYGGPDRKVTLTLTRTEGRGSMTGDVLQLDVIDRGEGIDPLHVPRLTERFYRVDTHRSRAMGGTGLGLAIVKHIVNRHRGRLRVSSRQGEGSVFSVIFPAAS